MTRPHEKRVVWEYRYFKFVLCRSGNLSNAYVMYVRMNESQNKFEIAMFPDHLLFRVLSGHEGKK